MLPNTAILVDAVLNAELDYQHMSGVPSRWSLADWDRRLH